MASTDTRNFDDEALCHAAEAERLLRLVPSGAATSNGAGLVRTRQILRAQVHATLAVAYSQIGDQS